MQITSDNRFSISLYRKRDDFSKFLIHRVMFFVRYFFSVFGAETFKKTRILIHVMNFGLLLRFCSRDHRHSVFQNNTSQLFWPSFWVFQKFNNTSITVIYVFFWFNDNINSKSLHKKCLRIWSHLLKKSLMENFIFCAVNVVSFTCPL